MLKQAPVLFLLSIGGAPSGQVLVGGAPVAGAESEVVIDKEVLETRDSDTDLVRLAPGRTSYRVFITASALVPAIEAACLPGALNPYVELMVEDGRSFSRCLVESSHTANHYSRLGRRRETRYGLRCEGVI
jgi:hypothetical protein